MRKPQLLAPGGGFDAAVQAFEAGADGVYLGLGEFSARASAVNFTLSQLRRIRTAAAERGRRIYVALNTVIRQAEMPRLAETLAWLEALSVDGVIVQDLGACRLVTEGFPRLPVHASTQMAVHNDAGLRAAEDLGIRRVILSRELSMERIRELRELHPGIELEVFIHGALCCSFSGLCLASSVLTGRSGNRGQCAQICRSSFRAAGRGPGHFFSCRDLALGTDVLKLAELGIDSLKIEGRMKSPEYVFHVTKLYRRILDSAGALDPAELNELSANASLSFSRKTTTGWLSSPRGVRLLEQDYPGHQGLPLGAVTAVSGGSARLTLLRDVSLHDGIGYWLPRSREPVIYPLLRITRGGRSVKFARAGETVLLPAAPSRRDPTPPVGAQMRIFSSRFLDRPRLKETAVPEAKVPVDLDVSLSRSGAAFLLSIAAAGGARGFSFSRAVTVEPASGSKPFAAVLEHILRESGGSPLSLGKLSFGNSTGLRDDGVFIPPSELKRVKNEMYAELDVSFAAALQEKARAACADADVPLFEPPDGAQALLSAGNRAALSRRDLLSPPGSRPIPFASLAGGALRTADLASAWGFHFVPLPPVMMNDRDWGAALRTLAESERDGRLAVGLNNVGHLGLAAGLAPFDNVFFFVDFFLYAANLRTLAFLRARMPRLLFAYSWIEGDEGGREASGFPVVRIDATFRPPLLYSLACLERHGAGRGACPDGCARDFEQRVRQGKNSFRVIVKDCVTYLFQDDCKETPDVGTPG